MNNQKTKQLISTVSVSIPKRSERHKKVLQGEKLRNQDKISRALVKIEPTTDKEKLAKPKWIRAKLSSGATVSRLKETLRSNSLHTVCEEASCPNLGECFGKGVASFMIMGSICTRRCTFCAVAHGRPNALDPNEPINLATTIAKMDLKHVVITSVDRDDLRDGGATHFTNCIKEIRNLSPNTSIEILTPDFRGREQKALDILTTLAPDIFNHNLETCERLYKEARPGSSYQVSLKLLLDFKKACPNVPTKSGIMVGLGETNDEVIQVLEDLRAHQVDMLTIGQYLQPSKYHIRLKRYVSPDEFNYFEKKALSMGFSHVAAGPMVRSSYFADESAKEVL